jgi:hypothetical protein
VAPDYLGPTFGYYFARTRPVVVHGFARWDDPQIFRPGDYAEIWNRPDAVSDTERRIREETRLGYNQLAVVWEAPTDHAGRIPYGRTYQLLSDLRRTYPLLREVACPGTHESVTLSLFALDSPHAGGQPLHPF